MGKREETRQRASQRRDAVTLSFFATMNDEAGRRRASKTEHWSNTERAQQNGKRAYHRAVATRLVILISAHDLIAASRTDRRTDGTDREREKEKERGSVSFVRVKRDGGAGEKEREAEEGGEKDIERCRDVLLPRLAI